MRCQIWEWPAKSWQPIHVGYVGPFMGRVFLIAVDAHSKWPEVLPTASASSERTIELLRDVFATYGLPQHLHGDNGSQFRSEVFRNFMKANNLAQLFCTLPPSDQRAGGTFRLDIQTGHEVSQRPLGCSKTTPSHPRVSVCLQKRSTCENWRFPGNVTDGSRTN